jgi:cAMP and cAMP-inhibited cGMP 3',5'-cyclic phosphodiesterase 10
MVSMDTLIKKVMNYAQKLVDADRASLFLLDNKNKELYARLFDMGGGQDYVMNSEATSKEPTKEIRYEAIATSCTHTQQHVYNDK